MAWRQDVAKKWSRNDAGNGSEPVTITVQIMIPELRPEPFEIVRRFNRGFWESLTTEQQVKLLAEMEAETQQRMALVLD